LTVAFIHPTAVVEDGVVLDEDVSVWHYTRIRTGARVGARTNIGGGIFIGADVSIGHDCKIANDAHLPEGSVVGDGVFIGPAAILTNDSHPRAVNPDFSPKEVEHWTMNGVVVEDGASVGAGAIVMAGTRVGVWALVAAGSVVTRDVDAHTLVQGVPARPTGRVCFCGTVIEDECSICGWRTPNAR
jgi:UDP-2-acetamido-3-amino-2,3-dideoxy-glucuronate N-acetyltransferase